VSNDKFLCSPNMAKTAPTLPPAHGVIYTEAGFRIIGGPVTKMELKEIQLRSKHYIRSCEIQRDRLSKLLAEQNVKAERISFWSRFWRTFS